MIEIEQKLIQIGSSEGITLLKKDLCKIGAKHRDLLKVELPNKTKNHVKILREYRLFVEKYGDTLKNLSLR